MEKKEDHTSDSMQRKMDELKASSAKEEPEKLSVNQEFPKVEVPQDPVFEDPFNDSDDDKLKKTEQLSKAFQSLAVRQVSKDPTLPGSQDLSKTPDQNKDEDEDILSKSKTLNLIEQILRT